MHLRGGSSSPQGTADTATTLEVERREMATLAGIDDGKGVIGAEDKADITAAHASTDRIEIFNAAREVDFLSLIHI